MCVLSICLPRSNGWQRENKMYKKEFNTQLFLRTKKDILDQIDYMDDVDALREFYHQIKNHNIHDLIDQLQTLQGYNTPQDKDERYHLEYKIEITQKLISNKLGLGFELHYMLDMLNEEFQKIEQGFERLEKYEGHRHKIGEGYYSEKPAY